MKAIVAHGAGDLRVEERDEPGEPAPEHTRVRIVYGGICGSDLHYARDGRNGGYTITEPLILGHEVVGVVQDMGPRTPESPPVGSQVAIHPATPTPLPGGTHGRGLNLARGGTYLGSASTNPHTQGGFVELLDVRVEQLRRLPDALPLRRAVLAEPLAVALHGISRLGDRVRGARVLVSGAGPIGCLAIAALRAAGADTVIAADLHSFPLDTAVSVGADGTVLLGTGQIAEEEFDIAVEAAGVTASLATALDAARPAGAVLQLGMLPGGPLPVPMAGLIAKELTLFGSQRFDVELDAALSLLEADDTIEAVISHRFHIGEAPSAFARAADSATSAKVVLRIGDDPDERSG